MDSWQLQLESAGKLIELLAPTSDAAAAPTSRGKVASKSSPATDRSGASADTELHQPWPTLQLSLPKAPANLKPKTWSQFFSRFVAAPPYGTVTLDSFCRLLLCPSPFINDVAAVLNSQLVAWAPDNAKGGMRHARFHFVSCDHNSRVRVCVCVCVCVCVRCSTL
jgi:hypothetical protein